MPYRFIEEEATADIAFEVWWANHALLFRDAGDALIKVMIDNPDDIRLTESRDIILNNDQLDLLLYNFRNNSSISKIAINCFYVLPKSSYNKLAVNGDCDQSSWVNK